MTTFHRLIRPIRVSLTLLLLALSGSRGTAQTIKTDTLRIFFAESPALLILIDGDPVYRSIAGTELERIVNTRAVIVRERSGIHYLKILDGWMQAYTLTGDWSVSGVAPAGGAAALERASDTMTVDLLDGSRTKAERPSLANQPPTIFISSEPAALIVTDGPERYQTVEGTSLESLVNTTAKVFREPTDQELYVLVAGRWYRAWTTDGPWQFIPTEELPADIANILRNRLLP
jgi:hypothetical protein